MATIIYITDYGTKPNNRSQSITSALTATALPTLTDPTHTFLGWYLTSNYDKNSLVKVGDTFRYTHNINSDSSITLYAKWVETEYLIQGKTLTDLSFEIQDLIEIYETLSPSEMIEKIKNIMRQKEITYIPLLTEIVAIQKGTYAQGDIIIAPVPYEEIENAAGGLTAIIGVEV